MLLATIRDPGGAVFERHAEDHGESICILPYDPARRVALLITMARAPVLIKGHPPVLEAIAGRLDGDEPADCARREAMEEGGVRLQDLEFVVKLFTLPGVSTERAYLFLAPYRAPDRVGVGGGLVSENEFIQVHEVPLEQLARMAACGEILDAKVLILTQTLQLRRPDLFRS
ncbi:NUDIX hydrolase [Phenylobacterium sp. J426]|uniref:NUDIX domain-containing protein n=1 Tax=Phenylobacterium sp. J426 TaxID=2898439 RepID=UPI002151F58A|nr:NUDIX hydrolase [Phenylobacterium sp. J426]MCR5876721.1 NUDIX hydrolase [Phenylobacterium sp. J426]